MYWIDVFGDNRAAFQAWRLVNAQTVIVRGSESFPDEGPGRDWLKFEVLKPTTWDAKVFGFPEIIPPGAAVNSSADTVQRPDPEKDPLDKLDDALGGAGGAAAHLVEVVAVIGGLLVLANLWSRSRGR